MNVIHQDNTSVNLQDDIIVKWTFPSNILLCLLLYITPVTAFHYLDLIFMAHQILLDTQSDKICSEMGVVLFLLCSSCCTLDKFKVMWTHKVNYYHLIISFIFSIPIIFFAISMLFHYTCV